MSRWILMMFPRVINCLHWLFLIIKSIIRKVGMRNFEWQGWRSFAKNKCPSKLKFNIWISIDEAINCAIDCFRRAKYIPKYFQPPAHTCTDGEKGWNLGGFNIWHCNKKIVKISAVTCNCYEVISPRKWL